MNKSALAAACLAALLTASIASAQTPRYEIIDIAVAGNTDGTLACAINNAGQVVGTRFSDGQDQLGYIWQNEKCTDLASLGGGSSTPVGINDLGVVVGSSLDRDGRTHYTKWVNGDAVDMGATGQYSGSLQGINNSGQIIGSQLGDNANYAFVINDGVRTDLLSLIGPNADAMAINDNGQIAGSAKAADDSWQACMWDGIAFNANPAGQYGWSYASDINNLGQMAGSVKSGERPGLWISGDLYELDILTGAKYGSARSLNDAGQVVGISYLPGEWTHACLWEGNAVIDLNSLIAPDSSWVLKYAFDINNSGQIVGVGTHNGEYRTYLLNPVPEPSSLLALTMGLITAAGAVRRRRN